MARSYTTCRDVTHALHVLDELLEERSPKRVSLVCPHVENGYTRTIGVALFELLRDQLHDRRFAGAPASIKTDGSAAVVVPDEVGDRRCQSVVRTAERVVSSGLVGEQPCRTSFGVLHAMPAVWRSSGYPGVILTEYRFDLWSGHVTLAGGRSKTSSTKTKTWTSLEHPILGSVPQRVRLLSCADHQCRKETDPMRTQRLLRRGPFRRPISGVLRASVTLHAASEAGGLAPVRPASAPRSTVAATHPAQG